VVEGALEELVEELDSLTEDDALVDAEDDSEDVLDVYLFIYLRVRNTGLEILKTTDRGRA